MPITISTFLKPWYRILDLARQTPLSWHLSRLEEEKAELTEPKSALEKLSEESDVFFTIGRATHDGYTIDEQPPFTKSLHHALVYAYMFWKYSSRCVFYQTAAILCRAEKWSVREVVNPARDGKIRVVAERHGICPEEFLKVCRRLRWVWPLLP
ncbi:hypothetical protein ONS95_002821 [Cadophora gregata]|uniref:uncharacterized protein n=1 Tax=Cadophora gregata TaxID=51156 RepID=UPI0026DADD56|nr:uncharacterized protein ONS95_002821 [Cadophora gregata]KAK0110170.1 hypothetical protein ONS95_002821 [Cadophora gregata]KAK0110215.1 hypothetical protein ONS96_001838 [Cadophora gregata f. sp. sojae]